MSPLLFCLKSASIISLQRIQTSEFTYWIKNMEEHMYTTEKMWKKFIRTRHYRKWRKKWCFPLQTEPENMTPEEFAMADAYMRGAEVASALPDGYDLRIDPEDAAKPNGGRKGKHITLSGIYWIAAAGKLFPDKSLRYNRLHILFTLLHEKHHLDIGKWDYCHKWYWPNAWFVRHCEECYCDMMATKDLMLLGVTREEIGDMMADRETFEKNAMHDGTTHPSRSFRSKIVAGQRWNKEAIQQVADHYMQSADIAKWCKNVTSETVDAISQYYADTLDAFFDESGL